MNQQQTMPQQGYQPPNPHAQQYPPNLNQPVNLYKDYAPNYYGEHLPPPPQQSPQPQQHHTYIQVPVPVPVPVQVAVPYVIQSEFDNGPTIEQRTEYSKHTSEHVRVVNKTGRTILIAYSRYSGTSVLTLSNDATEKIAVNDFTEKLEVTIGIPVDPYNIYGLCNVVMEKQRIRQGNYITVCNPRPIHQVTNFKSQYYKK